jgi:hypothetical protein
MQRFQDRILELVRQIAQTNDLDVAHYEDGTSRTGLLVLFRKCEPNDTAPWKLVQYAGRFVYSFQSAGGTLAFYPDGQPADARDECRPFSFRFDMDETGWLETVGRLYAAMEDIGAAHPPTSRSKSSAL